MWTEGTVAVSEKDYSGITGVLAHSLVWKNKCLIYINATGCHKALRGRSVGTNTVLVPYWVSCTALAPPPPPTHTHTAAIMEPSLAAVSTVGERRAFTSSIAVYSSGLLLQLLKLISVRVLSSTGTGTSTSTRPLQVPSISSVSPCLYFTVIRSQLSAALHCCL
jgi:hypothetical protein